MLNQLKISHSDITVTCPPEPNMTVEGKVDPNLHTFALFYDIL